MRRVAVLAWIAWDASSFFEWLSNRPWYHRILVDWAATVPVVQGDNGLELGCGPGLLTAHLHAQGVNMIGLDRSQSMLARARRRAPNSTFLCGDALALPLENDSVDVAFGASVVNVVSDPEKLVNEMLRVVRPGGLVSVLFPTPLLADRAPAVVRQEGLKGMSAAALKFWGSKAPKRDSATIEALFESAGLLDIRVDKFFQDTIASVTGRVR